jgi:predicted RNA-binding protein with PIN domain
VPGRRPIPLPPGLLEEAPESAEHLVRTNGVVLVVDGYNVSHACWPELAIAEQRRRLVDALSELAARTGADVEVVFDGGEHDQPAPPGATRQLVKTRFSPPGTEADDVILEMVERYPAHRPVVVATSDRRVRDGVRQRGANVISAGQLLKVLRRDRGW